MPKEILAAIKASEKKAGKPDDEAEKIAYATANKLGYLKGRLMTAKGAVAEAQYRHDRENPADDGRV